MIPPPLFSASIPGEWAQGWLYKDHLFLWNNSGALLHAPVSKFVQSIADTHDQDIALAAQLALFRNDWKGGLQTSALFRPARIRDSLRATAHAAGLLRGVELSSSDLSDVDVEDVPGMLLSVSIYGNHAFIASSEGLFEANLNPNYLDRSVEILQRLQAAAHDVETNYGAVAVSAFEEGLWFDEIDFGEGASWQFGGPMQRIGEYSTGVSMASTNLLNFTDEGVPDLYLGHAERRRQSGRSRYESVAVTGYERASADLSYLSARGLDVDESFIRDGRVRLLANSRQQLLYDVDGELRLLRLLTGANVRLDRPTSLKAKMEDVTTGSHLISTHALGAGFLMETFERVVWVDRTGIHDVTAAPAVSVRTFPGSKHFQDTALIIEEDRALLVGFLDFPKA